jgi:hypothetical protein
MTLLDDTKLKIAATLTNNASIICLEAAVLALVFYFICAAREFADSTQLLILHIMLATGIALAIFAFFSILITILEAVLVNKKSWLLHTVIYFVFLLFALVLVFFSGVVTVLSEGNIL